MMMMAAAQDQSHLSLLNLEDELSCSICLSTFDCPVTIPCGHNFCQDCLLATWKDSYSCPQCRTVFATKPELKKNTVLSTVAESFRERASRSREEQKEERGARREEEQEEEEERGARREEALIRCDTCMEAEASHTCLTCMASFCEEHLRPHRENPVFRLHQLGRPVGDLSERICPDHHKLMELFCCQHDRPICSLCLQQVHKGCSFTSPEEQRSRKEVDFRQKLSLLDEKINKTESVKTQMMEMQNQLKDAAQSRKLALASVYQQMMDLVSQDQREAQLEVDRELELSQTRLQNHMKTLSGNSEKMRTARERITSLLSGSHTAAFLQASFDLPKVVKSDPHVARIHLDSKKVTATQSFAAALVDSLTEVLKQPVEDRSLLLTAGVTAAPVPGPAGAERTRSQPEPEPPKNKGRLRARSPGRPLLQPYLQLAPVLPFAPILRPEPGWNPYQYGHGDPLWTVHNPMVQLAPGDPRLPRSPGPGPQPRTGQKTRTQNKTKKSTEDSVGNKTLARSMDNLLECGGKDKPEPKQKPETSDPPPDITSAHNRKDLLQYGTVLTLDLKTAHRRIVLTEGFTKASVSAEPANYPDRPERFSVCSQVLASKGFSRGRHYWEVQLDGGNFVGIGLAYGSMDRKGPASRLGRNAQSWCVEWFNVKLSAWHNSSETVLANPNPRRVGVLLDCEGGTATFYNVADRAYPFHCFVFPFAEAVYPAFWIFSSGSSVSLCKLQA